MNYIKLINAFWQLRRERPDFDPYVIALYFALVDIANRRDWKTFTAYREDVVTLAGMSAKPYYKARTILKEAGLIDFKEGSSKTTMCSFTINQLFPTVTEATTEGQQLGNSSDHGTETEATTILNKPLNNKPTTPSDAKAPGRYSKFLDFFNSQTGRAFKALDDKTKRQLDKLIKAGYTHDDFRAAIKSGYEDSKTWAKPNLFTPELFTRDNQFVKYLNWQSAPEPYDPAKASQPNAFATLEEKDDYWGGRNPNFKPNPEPLKQTA